MFCWRMYASLSLISYLATQMGYRDGMMIYEHGIYVDKPIIMIRIVDITV